MSYELSRNESVLPPGYKLQVIKNAEGFLETVPLGTNHHIPYGGGIGYRERIAIELSKLFAEEYGFDEHPRDFFVICADIEGNECVWCKARVHPRIKRDQISWFKDKILQIEKGNSDVIDI